MSIILKQLDKNYFQLTYPYAKINEKIIEDLLYHVWTNRYKLDESELDIALDDMLENDNNICQFGISGNFVFSEKAKQ